MDLTCIHADRGLTGLCPPCQEECDTDPLAYWEFGAHPEGEARWAALEAEMAAQCPVEVDPAAFDWDAEIPF